MTHVTLSRGADATRREGTHNTHTNARNTHEHAQGDHTELKPEGGATPRSRKTSFKASGSSSRKGYTILHSGEPREQHGPHSGKDAMLAQSA